MSDIKIRKGVPEDADAIMAVYDAARKYMRANGNFNQWINGYPSREEVLADIGGGNNYVGEDAGGRIVMAFAFFIGEDPTYAVIEDGAWLNDRPYGTIHRLGSDGKYPGMLKACIDYCFTQTGNLRFDTHADNRIMLAAARSLGFRRCGIIYCSDGSPRIAFQKTLE